jgi:hypothetical protein
MPDRSRPERCFQNFMSRRDVLGAAASLLVVNEGSGAEPVAPEQKVFQKGDRIVLDGDPQTILQKAYELGHDYEARHGGCARCTVAALQDALPMLGVDEGLFRASTCLDGGATPVAEQNCGGFTGAGMVIGYLCGSRRNGEFHGSAGLAHQLLHEVYDRFAKEYGTVLCRDVRKGVQGDCPEAVGRAARWTAEALLAAFADVELPPEPETAADTPKDASIETTPQQSPPAGLADSQS